MNIKETVRNNFIFLKLATTITFLILLLNLKMRKTRKTTFLFVLYFGSSRP